MIAKRRAFVEHYLRCWNAAEAARKAGYSERTAYSQGPRLLKVVEVQKEIERRLESLQMGTDEVLMRLTEQARGEGGKYIEYTGVVNMARLIGDGQEHLIKSVKFNQRGDMTVEFYDAQAALDKIARIKGMMRPEVEVAEVSVHVHGFEDLLSKVYGSPDVELET